MRTGLFVLVISWLSFFSQSCTTELKSTTEPAEKGAQDILGNPDYLAMAYGGYRGNTRDEQPTLAQIREDMLLLHAMGVRIVRTYNTELAHATTLLEAIRDIKSEDADFEMYVMLGAWINCEQAWTAQPNHEAEDEEGNAAEIQRAVEMARAYPDIVKVIAVGNEAMVKWAAGYFVQPGIILKWVNHLQALKAEGSLPENLWITSSDNFASWGGGDTTYHVPDLEALIRAVDYVSMHTYPMHDTHYNPEFWGVDATEEELDTTAQIEQAMLRARDYAVAQYEGVVGYLQQLGIDKPVHIGETGWATYSNEFYGAEGSRACDEYKSGRYYQLMRDWTNSAGIACFYFEAFDEPWKAVGNPGGSENHFGLFTVEGKAKYALWDLVEAGVFNGLSRDGHPVVASYDGSLDALLQEVRIPPRQVD